MLTVSQIYWTQQVTEAIRQGPDELKAFAQRSQEGLEDIVELVRGDLSDQARGCGAVLYRQVHWVILLRMVRM